MAGQKEWLVMNLADLTAKAVSFLTWLESFAVNQKQRTDDEGFAAIARLANKIGALLALPENAADMAAISRMAAQDLPKPSEQPVEVTHEPPLHVGGRPNGTDRGTI